MSFRSRITNLSDPFEITTSTCSHPIIVDVHFFLAKILKHSDMHTHAYGRM